MRAALRLMEMQDRRDHNHDGRDQERYCRDRGKRRRGDWDGALPPIRATTPSCRDAGGSGKCIARSDVS